MAHHVSHRGGVITIVTDDTELSSQFWLLRRALTLNTYFPGWRYLNDTSLSFLTVIHSSPSPIIW